MGIKPSVLARNISKTSLSYSRIILSHSFTALHPLSLHLGALVQ